MAAANLPAKSLRLVCASGRVYQSQTRLPTLIRYASSATTPTTTKAKRKTPGTNAAVPPKPTVAPPQQQKSPKVESNSTAEGSTGSNSTETPIAANPPKESIEVEVPVRKYNWLTRYLMRSPRAMEYFVKMMNRDPKQTAGRRAFVLYEHLCVPRADEEEKFWRNQCHLPPTFQSWFLITNLHIWLLSVRLRALPAPHGTYYTQALVDHFFLDIEDRIRAVLQPTSKLLPSHITAPYTFPSKFYRNPNVAFEKDAKTGKEIRVVKGRAPDRLVKRQMMIFKEQYNGMGMWLDYGLVKGDMELAATVWRNLLGARGAQGFVLPEGQDGKQVTRRAVNLVGGKVDNVAKVDFDKEALTDDGSGVFDFPPSEVDQYVKFPETMFEIVEYLRSEVVRMEAIPDEYYTEFGKIQKDIFFRKIKP